MLTTAAVTAKKDRGIIGERWGSTPNSKEIPYEKLHNVPMVEPAAVQTPGEGRDITALKRRAGGKREGGLERSVYLGSIGGDQGRGGYTQREIRSQGRLGEKGIVLKGNSSKPREAYACFASCENREGRTDLARG